LKDDLNEEADDCGGDGAAEKKRKDEDGDGGGAAGMEKEEAFLGKTAGGTSLAVEESSSYCNDESIAAGAGSGLT